MNIYSRTGKHFESAVGCPVDFVIGCVQSGKVLGPEGCYTVTSRISACFHRECCPSCLCTFVHCKYSVRLVYTVFLLWLFRV